MYRRLADYISCLTGLTFESAMNIVGEWSYHISWMRRERYTLEEIALTICDLEGLPA